MRASEWQFLCAVHETPKSCCAIDYCCHTLDWATNIVTSQKIFPSRLSLAAGDAGDDRGAGVKHLINIFRRLHRIFAHAWFQHRGVFWQVEGQTGLYVLFKTVCDYYELLPAENYKLPPEAEGLEPVEEVRAAAQTILKPQSSAEDGAGVEEDVVGVGRNNTRRHIRQSPSVGSAVTTVLESDEEDPADVTQKLGEITLAEEEEWDGDGGSEIPVIVETYEVDEHHDGSPERPQSEAVEPAEIPANPHDEHTSSPTSSSWDDMSSELAEKAEEPEEPKEASIDAETVAKGSTSEVVPMGEPAPEAEKEAETKTEPEAKEEGKEETSAEEAEEDKEVDAS